MTYAEEVEASKRRAAARSYRVGASAWTLDGDVGEIREVDAKRGKCLMCYAFDDDDEYDYDHLEWVPFERLLPRKP